MKFKTLTGEYKGEQITITQVTKSVAKKHYDEGRTIYLNPCNMKPFSTWSMLCEVTKEKDITFEHAVNVFVYYNCSSPQIGLRPVFFIKNITNLNNQQL